MTTETIQHPVVPTDVPLIVHTPDADEEAVAACHEVERIGRAAAQSAENRSFRDAYNLLSDIENAVHRARVLLTAAHNGDLNVDEMVLAQFPEGDYQWHHLTDLERKLREMDTRLTKGQYVKNPGDRWAHISNMDVVIKRLLAEGVLKKHQGGQMYRRRKPGEK